ncbi:hypothetical protein GGI20_003525 [Coemansia sp. BCRC 34301]|nr:hypothetical protein GGI20_003525 [Coemansia sp. BCRC 34301]
MEAIKHASQTRPHCPTCSRCSAMDTDQEIDGVIKPLSWARLDRIKRGVSAKASTWDFLRTEYPLSRSSFAPLNIVSDQGVLDPDAGAPVDEVYSQAATMAAYGFELLHAVLSSS